MKNSPLMEVNPGMWWSLSKSNKHSLIGYDADSSGCQYLSNNLKDKVHSIF